MTAPSVDPRGAGRAAPIEIGWIQVGGFEPNALAAIEDGRARLRDWYVDRFPAFSWRVSTIHRDRPDVGTDEPTDLLALGAAELERSGWDFAIVVTAAELRAYQKERTHGAPSKAIGVAALSVAHLDDDGFDRLGPRVGAAAIHLLADLIGAPHSEDDGCVTTPPSDVDDLDRMRRLDLRSWERMQSTLARVADARLEERFSDRRPAELVFMLRVVAREIDSIARAVWEAQPWSFPIRLSRMTTAAVSALLLFLLSAEVWDLGASQTLATSLLLLAASIAGTSVFLLKRQRLVIGSQRAPLTEQAAVARIAVRAIVTAGLLSTYALLLGVALLLAAVLFPRSLVDTWTSSVDDPLGWTHYLGLANLAASFCVMVGTLGASFEGHHYIRQVTYVDEEL